MANVSFRLRHNMFEIVTNDSGTAAGGFYAHRLARKAGQPDIMVTWDNGCTGQDRKKEIKKLKSPVGDVKKRKEKTRRDGRRPARETRCKARRGY